MSISLTMASLSKLRYMQNNMSELHIVYSEEQKELFNVCKNGNLELVRHILKEHDDSWTMVALFTAVRFGHIGIVESIVKDNTLITAFDYRALKLAAYGRHLDIFKFLCQYLTVTDINNSKAVIYAANNKALDIIKYIYDIGGDIHLCEYATLREACQKCNIDIVQYLCEHNADVNVAEAILNASRNANIQIVKYLHEQNADLTIYNSCALAYAVGKNKYDVLKYLLENNCDINANNKNEIKHHLALNNRSTLKNFKIIKLLLETSTELCIDKNDVLHLAAEAGDLFMVKYLCENGANVRSGNNYAQYISKLKNHTDIVQYLSQYYVSA